MATFVVVAESDSLGTVKASTASLPFGADSGLIVTCAQAGPAEHEPRPPSRARQPQPVATPRSPSLASHRMTATS